MERNTVITRSKKIYESYLNKPDAAGNYFEYPIQFFFLIVHGVQNNGSIEIIKNLRYDNLNVDKKYPQIKMVEGSGNAGFYKGKQMPFSVSIKAPKDFKKITGKNFKELINNSPKDQDGQPYNGELTYYFNNFIEANEFYQSLCEKLNLKDFTYKNYRYDQHLHNNAPE
jgi:hypothetical protein